MAEKERKPKTAEKVAATSAKTAKSEGTTKSAKAKTVKSKTTAKSEKAKTTKVTAAIASKSEAPEKQQKEKSAKSVKKAEKKAGEEAKPKLAALVKTRKFKIIAISSVAVIFVLCITLGIVFGVGRRTTDGGITDEPTFVVPPNLDGGDLTEFSVVTSHKNKTQVGFSAEIIDTVERVKPVAEVKNEGLSSKGYPRYGSTLNLTSEEKTTVIQENRKLTANGTWVDSSSRTSGTYDKMDKDGYLYKKDGSKPNAGVPQQLYKHTGAVGLYGGDVADDEPAVIKNLTFRPRSYGSYYNVTGLYAPAGEVIKIEMTDGDMTATGGITIHIGQALYNGQANNIWEQKGFNRMPVILNTMSVTKETATYDEETGLWTGYVGSFLGGPIYVRGAASTFSVTISGGVNYAHFILGVTTEEDFAAYSESSAPYFDLEVWDRGVLHSGPKRAAKNFGYNDLYKAAVLWEKISLVTTSVSNQGIVFLYDPFVAAGAAVAFPGRRSVNCPEGWMSGSLNYNGIVTSGSWGNLHEYHHNFQDYGVGYTGEVTNNGLNLVSYSLFTKISSSRQLSGYGGAGLSGWNQYTSATWALQRVNNNQIESTNGLAVYATLLHNFGQDAYIKTRGAWGSNYYDKWANCTQQDMSYYAGLVSSYGGGYTPSDAVRNANYPLFVPVSCVYQTGRTFMYDNQKREIKTMQPYVIPYGKSFKVDLRPYANLTNNGADSGQYDCGSIVIAKDFKFTIKNIKTVGLNGTFVETGEKDVYTFTPNGEMNSGKIYVTLEITTKDGKHEWNGHKLNDVDLVLEFQQSHETNKSVLERTTYFYTADAAYKDARTAFENGYAGYESRRDMDHSNPTQNANTDIWYCTENSVANFPKADPAIHIVTPNSIDELRGKIYIPEAGKYRFYLRGRRNCALYYSLDGGKTYQLGTNIALNDGTNGSSGFVEGNHFDLVLPAESWVYIKEVLINVRINANMAGYIGVGIAQWTTPMFTTEVKYYAGTDNGRKELTQETADGATKYYYMQGAQKTYVDNASVQAETHYYTNKNGQKTEVSAEEANDTEPKPPELRSAAYATAYRQSYEFNKEFVSDYFYVRDYGYNYTDNVMVPKDAVTVTETNYTPTGWGSGMPITNVTDGKTNTYIHTSWKVTENNPLKLTFDLGDARTINRIKFYCRNNNGQLETPKVFTVEGSLDGTEWFDVASFTDAPRNGNQVTADFDAATFRYCRIIICSTHQGSYFVVIGETEFWNINEINGGSMYSPDNERFGYRGTWQAVQTNASFGHVYLGTAGNEICFEVETKSDRGRLGILTSDKYGQNFEVYVDGQKVETEKLKDDRNETALRYLTPKLSEGSHTVTVKCTGEANIDSFVVFP